uniref:Uncharacterized protein n=1 Tax=viral metagenome TaxID=1070528 RepID=A0A6C0H9C3_9ZZZZ
MPPKSKPKSASSCSVSDSSQSISIPKSKAMPKKLTNKNSDDNISSDQQSDIESIVNLNDNETDKEDNSESSEHDTPIKITSPKKNKNEEVSLLFNKLKINRDKKTELIKNITEQNKELIQNIKDEEKILNIIENKIIKKDKPKRENIGLNKEIDVPSILCTYLNLDPTIKMSRPKIYSIFTQKLKDNKLKEGTKIILNLKTLKELKLSFEIIQSKLKPNVLEHLEFTDTSVSFQQTRLQSILGLFYKE